MKTVEELMNECSRLTKCLEAANSNHEKFERLFYLEQQSKEAALEIIEQYGGFDGAHHKQWILDQVVRKLVGDKYEEWVKEMCGEYDEEEEMYEYDWDEGIPP
jgi:predicted  nucleic acid-binding Zn-ribbon protein